MRITKDSEGPEAFGQPVHTTDLEPSGDRRSKGLDCHPKNSRSELQDVENYSV